MPELIHTSEIIAFIRRNSSLFWYTPEDKKEEISEEFLVETILNYGDLNAVKELLALMGKEKMANVFYSAIGRKKRNYFPEIYNFFNLYFQKNVSRNSQ